MPPLMQKPENQGTKTKKPEFQLAMRQSYLLEGPAKYYGCNRAIPKR
jgi:hypothetical protein